MSRILIVEDEQHISDGLRFNLEAEGHEAVVAADGEHALDLLLKERRAFDVVVLDVMLPGKDGFTVAAELRAAEQFMPILMLTARSRPEDVLKGFEAGADDYLPKPFELAILLARIHGLLRRRRWNEQDAEPDEAQSEVFAFAGRTLDFGAMEVRALGKSHRLTQMECDRVAGNHPRGRMGTAREHRYTSDRQLHRSAAALHRRSSRVTEDPADRAGSRL
jgi:DNA-binding response OmpR family regulator